MGGFWSRRCFHPLWVGPVAVEVDLDGSVGCKVCVTLAERRPYIQSFTCYEHDCPYLSGQWPLLWLFPNILFSSFQALSRTANSLCCQQQWCAPPPSRSTEFPEWGTPFSCFEGHEGKCWHGSLTIPDSGWPQWAECLQLILHVQQEQRTHTCCVSPVIRRSFISTAEIYLWVPYKFRSKYTWGGNILEILSFFFPFFPLYVMATSSVFIVLGGGCGGVKSRYPFIY